MPFKKGYRVTEEVRQKMIAARAQHKPHIVGRYGLTEEYVREQIAAGKIWCSDCKQFREPDKFGNQKKATSSRRCKECSGRRDLQRYERQKEYELARRSAHYFANKPSERKRKKKWAMSRYGATQEWYNQKLTEQGGGCALCETTIPSKRSSYMHIDHRHGCCPNGKACDRCRRGLLCSRCNGTLERVESVPGWSEKALAYLARYR